MGTRLPQLVHVGSACSGDGVVGRVGVVTVAIKNNQGDRTWGSRHRVRTSRRVGATATGRLSLRDTATGARLEIGLRHHSVRSGERHRPGCIVLGHATGESVVYTLAFRVLAYC